MILNGAMQAGFLKSNKKSGLARLDLDAGVEVGC
jgi:hypothetical protein